jgi:hypothetical protein
MDQRSARCPACRSEQLVAEDSTTAVCETCETRFRLRRRRTEHRSAESESSASHEDAGRHDTTPDPGATQTEQLEPAAAPARPLRRVTAYLPEPAPSASPSSNATAPRIAAPPKPSRPVVAPAGPGIDQHEPDEEAPDEDVEPQAEPEDDWLIPGIYR